MVRFFLNEANKFESPQLTGVPIKDMRDKIKPLYTISVRGIEWDSFKLSFTRMATTPTIASATTTARNMTVPSAIVTQKPHGFPGAPFSGEVGALHGTVSGKGGICEAETVKGIGSREDFSEVSPGFSGASSRIGRPLWLFGNRMLLLTAHSNLGVIA